ncbi:hypothetical protein HPB52_025713 [Rhipicephalus sanguineus]|uniref:Uncharacterized protein n=1 Tax=Rhipicephalus sanguineus TaxID=34632 RepID=A0A9D4TCM3_RHISA|nr:hypothetical protein HPB52_025713 [Rhipicephalus sanguineus]
MQTIRRHYLALVIEVIFVVAAFAFFLHLDRVDLNDVRKLNSTVLKNVARERVDLSELDLTKVFVVYGPSNDRTDKLAKKLLGNTDDTSIDYYEMYDDGFGDYGGDTPILPPDSDDTDGNASTSE